MQPFNTACKNCRVAKTKCLRIDENDDGKCRRCRGAGWECSLMPRAARKRRKRMDARVEVLEGQLREIEQLMGRAKGRGLEMGKERNEATMGKEVPPAVVLPLTPDSAGVDEGSRTMAFSAASFGSESAVVDERAMEMDVLREETTSTLPGIVPDILTFDTAKRLFERFRNETVAQFPLLQLPPNTAFSDLATHKPTLLLAIVTAASMSTTGSLFKTLHTELTTRLAMKVIVNGERSLELVQAVLTMEVWYCFPEELEDRESGVNFYQWIHIAATMALQLGLGGRWDERDRRKGMEEARIALAVWASCSS
ncbi:hypothetical protein M409DRAFT_51457 [Zasmidium cellare ATCC 36951]|uniref:Zn(2)-C6 fungal-type domain-containing protein n=1 Tax=Zasmidium cellare ATCC 36951 TaxID=1080233 RepID=A0A6A6CX39_ZASCE|nr:uncharacterized protein M409DRAFT_51457 [Zasmidium cellare ATCC 36951]KAF2170412.1 hypothetical protein M409DRAFT_51457 [Zasmidium cellare ATCC 36951]